MKRIVATILALFALLQGVAAQQARAMAIVDSASVNVNFTDFGFFDAEGVRRDDEVLVVTGANFEVVSDIELGNATATTDGDAAACNFAECGIISIFPLRVESSASADDPALSRAIAAGRAVGELTFTNSTDDDLTFRFFLEIDTFWDELRADNPATETAQFERRVSFEYDGVETEVTNLLFEGDADGLPTDEVCIDFPDEICAIRESFLDFSLPAGATRTLRGIAEMTALAEVGPTEIALPDSFSLAAIALMAIALVRTRHPRI